MAEYYWDDYSPYDFSGIDWNAIIAQLNSQPSLLETVYSEPTPQPVEAVPYYELAPQPIYSQPTPQPVEAVPYYEPAPAPFAGVGYQQQPTPQPLEAVTEPVAGIGYQQPVARVAYSDDAEVMRPADIRAQLSDEMTITPREMAAAPMANNGEVSPFTINPYMVVNYGEETNAPSFANTQNLDPTKSYTLVNQRTGEKMVSNPNDPTSLARLVLEANQLSGNSATGANWDIYSGDTSIASDRPNYTGGVLGALLQYGLPIGLSLIPGVGWAGSAALAGVGSTAGKLISGYDLSDALKSGALTAATAGLLKAPILGGGSSIGGTIGGALGDVPVVGDALKAVTPSGSYTNAAGDIIVQGALSNPLIESAASSLIGSGAFAPDYSGLGQYAAPSYTGVQSPDQPPAESNQPGIVVEGIRPVTEFPPVPISVTPTPAPSEVIPEGMGEDIVVSKEKPVTVLPQIPVPVTPSTPVSGYDPATNTITAVADTSKPIQDAQNVFEAVVPPLNSVDIPANAGDVTPKKGLSTLDYIRMGLLAPKLIGGIADLLGGEDNTVITPDQSRVNYNPLNRQRTVSGIGAAPFDVFTYGQNKPGAQQSEYEFFRPYSTSIGQQAYTPVSSYDRYTQADVDAANANLMANYNSQLANFNTYQDNLAQQVGAGSVTPDQAQALAQQYASGLGYQAAVPTLKDGGKPEEGGEMSDEMVRHLVEWNKGNGHRGPGQVKGIGSGQEDLIPAWLSDGEYVWSAQDVADLGDGSTDEGVRRLDKMRQMVRGRAGRKDVKKIAKPQQGIEAMLKAVGGKV